MTEFCISSAKEAILLEYVKEAREEVEGFAGKAEKENEKEEQKTVGAGRCELMRRRQ